MRRNVWRVGRFYVMRTVSRPGWLLSLRLPRLLIEGATIWRWSLGRSPDLAGLRGLALGPLRFILTAGPESDAEGREGPSA